MERKVWQTLAAATAFYFVSAAPGYAEELPLPTSAEDVAATIQELATTVAAVSEVVPEAPPAPPVELPRASPAAPQVATAASPAPEAPRPPPEPAQTPTESQYQAPEPQYHPAGEDEGNTAEEAVAAVADVVPVAIAETNAPTTEQPPPAAAQSLPAGEQSPTATATSAENSTISSLPSTWIWNWNWNCDPSQVPPEQNSVVDGTWTWNWNHNCAPADAPAGTGQYQGLPTQYQPQNTNISIRIGSPGDNGPVTQTIAAVTQTTAAAVNTIAQTVVQEAVPLFQEVVGPSPAAPAATGSTGAITLAAVVAQVVTAASEVFAAVLPSAVALPPTVTALPLSPVVPWPEIAMPPALGELLGALGVRPTPQATTAVPASGAPRTKPSEQTKRAPSSPALFARILPARLQRVDARLGGPGVGPDRSDRSTARLFFGCAAGAGAATGAAAADSDAGARRLVRRRRRRELRFRRGSRRYRGATRLLPPCSPVRHVPRADRERQSTSPAALGTARAAWLAPLLRTERARAACPRATSKKVKERPQ